VKLAFCFLSIGDIAHRTAWSAFFQGVPSTDYAIWLHRADGHATSALPGARCVPSHGTTRATFSIVKAQQVLFEAACQDESVSKCILLSGDTVPLHPFETVSKAIMSHARGVLAWEAVASDEQASRARLTRRYAWPREWEWVWRVASQWCALTREHVQLLSRYWGLLFHVFFTSHTPDEHLYPVFFHALGLLDSFVREPFMYVDWLHPTEARPCGREHHLYPRTFHLEDLTPSRVRELRQRNRLMLRKVCESDDCPPLWIEPDGAG
jgi:hypothetical protein